MRDPKILAEVKEVLTRLSEIAPGRAVEVRVPPYAAIQCVAGPKHRRGTPPNVVEMSHKTLMDLINREVEWQSAIASGEIHASGERSDLSRLFVELAEAIRITP